MDPMDLLNLPFPMVSKGVGLLIILSCLGIWGRLDDRFEHPGYIFLVGFLFLIFGFITSPTGIQTQYPTGNISEPSGYFNNSIGMEFVKIPAGEFMMGSPDE